MSRGENLSVRRDIPEWKALEGKMDLKEGQFWQNVDLNDKEKKAYPGCTFTCCFALSNPAGNLKLLQSFASETEVMQAKSNVFINGCMLFFFQVRNKNGHNGCLEMSKSQSCTAF